VQENFLADLRALNPELCITAAYGNILPSKFLEIPPFGKGIICATWVSFRAYGCGKWKKLTQLSAT